MPSKKTKRILTFWVIVALAFFSIFVYLLWSIFSSYKISTMKSIEIKNETKRNESLSFLKKDLEMNKNSINKVYDYVIKSEDAIDFIKKIENLAKDNNLKPEIKSVSLDPISGTDLSNIESMTIQLEVVGGWSDVEYFIEILENYPLSLSIKKFSLIQSFSGLVKNKKVSEWICNINFSVIKIKDKQ